MTARGVSDVYETTFRKYSVVHFWALKACVGNLELQREAKQQQIADWMNVLFERGDRFEEKVGYGLPVNLHQVGDLFVVHAFKVFEENGLFLAAGQLFNGAAYLDLVFAQ